MKSVFERIKDDVCKELQKTNTLIELKNKLAEVLNEWDLSEEN